MISFSSRLGFLPFFFSSDLHSHLFEAQSWLWQKGPLATPVWMQALMSVPLSSLGRGGPRTSGNPPATGSWPRFFASGRKMGAEAKRRGSESPWSAYIKGVNGQSQDVGGALSLDRVTCFSNKTLLPRLLGNQSGSSWMMPLLSKQIAPAILGYFRRCWPIGEFIWD